MSQTMAFGLWTGLASCIVFQWTMTIEQGAAVLSTAPPNAAYRLWAKRLGVNAR